MKKVLKKVVLFVCIALLIFGCIIAIRFIKISNILKSQRNNLENDNYYMKYTKGLTDGEEIESEMYIMKGKQYIKTKNYRILEDEEDEKVYVIIDELKTVNVYSISSREASIGSEGQTNILTQASDSFKDKLSYVFKWKITTENKDGVECDHIKLDDSNEIWIDKETKLLKEEKNYEDITKVEKIELNNVVKEDFELTGIDGYKIVNN